MPMTLIKLSVICLISTPLIHPFGLSSSSIPVVFTCWPSASRGQTREAPSGETVAQIWPDSTETRFPNRQQCCQCHCPRSKMPTTARKFLHAELSSSYLTSQTLLLVYRKSGSPPLPSTLSVSHGSFGISLPTKQIQSVSARTLILLFSPLVMIHIFQLATYNFILSLRLLSRTPSGYPASKFMSLTLFQCPSSVNVLTLFSLYYDRKNKSLLSGFFLESFKSAIVRPLLKKPFL